MTFDSRPLPEVTLLLHPLPPAPGDAPTPLLQDHRPSAFVFPRWPPRPFLPLRLLPRRGQSTSCCSRGRLKKNETGNRNNISRHIYARPRSLTHEEESPAQPPGHGDAKHVQGHREVVVHLRGLKGRRVKLFSTSKEEITFPCRRKSDGGLKD